MKPISANRPPESVEMVACRTVYPWKVRDAALDVQWNTDFGLGLPLRCSSVKALINQHNQKVRTQD